MSFAWTVASLPGRRGGRVWVHAVLAAALGIGTYAYRYLSFERFPNDHFVHLSRAQQIVFGSLPVRDYAEYQLPLQAMVSAMAQMAFGPGLRSELWLVCGAFAVASVGTYLLTAAVGRSTTVGVAATAILVMATPVSYSYPKVLPHILALGAAWLYAGAPGTGRLFLLAASVVFAGLLRHDHAVVLGSGAAAVVLARHGFSRNGAIAMARLLVAGLLLAAPYILWVEQYEGIVDYIASNLDTGFIEAEKANWAPARFEIDRTHPLFIALADPQELMIYVRWRPGLPTAERQRHELEHDLTPLDELESNTGQYTLGSWSAASLEGLLRDPAVEDTQGIDRTAFRLEDRRPLSARLLQDVVLPGEGLRTASVAVLYYLSWILPLAAALLVSWRWAGLTPQVRTVAAMAIVVQLVMSRMMLRDPLPTRVRDVVAPLVVLLAFLPVAWSTLEAGTLARWVRHAGLVAIFVLAAGGAAGAGSFGANLREMRIALGWQGLVERAAEIRTRYVSPHERTGDQRSELADYVMACTRQDSRIFAMTFVPELFFYTGRAFAGGYDALHSRFYSSDRQATRILQRLSHEDVPLIIMDNETDSEVFETHPRVGKYVKERYHEVGRFNVGQGKGYIVLAENGRPFVGIFGKWDLPCFAAFGPSQVRSVK